MLIFKKISFYKKKIYKCFIKINVDAIFRFQCFEFVLRFPFYFVFTFFVFSIFNMYSLLWKPMCFSICVKKKRGKYGHLWARITQRKLNKPQIVITEFTYIWLFLHPNSFFSLNHFSGSELYYLAHTAIYWLRNATA